MIKRYKDASGVSSTGNLEKICDGIIYSLDS